MITITLRLSESLLCILRDAGTPKPETSEICIASGCLVKALLSDQGINPLLVPMVGLSIPASRDKTQKRINMNTFLDQDGILTLYGPLAGG